MQFVTVFSFRLCCCGRSLLSMCSRFSIWSPLLVASFQASHTPFGVPSWSLRSKPPTLVGVPSWSLRSKPPTLVGVPSWSLHSKPPTLVGAPSWSISSKPPTLVGALLVALFQASHTHLLVPLVCVLVY